MRQLNVSFPEPCGEKWDDMVPTGCNRHCARCDTVIHDLETYTFETVEALIETGKDVCVRARLQSDGTVALKRGRKGAAGRLVIAAASAGLMAVGSSALAQGGGKITGEIDTTYWAARVYATDASGKTYRARIKRDGAFWIKNVPPGEYEVTATSCEGSWSVGKVRVGNGEVRMPTAREPDDEFCIVVGLLKVESVAG